MGSRKLWVVDAIPAGSGQGSASLSVALRKIGRQFEFQSGRLLPETTLDHRSWDELRHEIDRGLYIVWKHFFAVDEKITPKALYFQTPRSHG